ncbi:hypothetical protein D3C72_1457880 [compost metagenome]
MAAFTGDQADIHLRIGRVKAVQTRHQPIGGEGKIRGHLQHFMLLLCADCAQSCVDILQTELNLLKKNLPSLCQFDSAINAVEQACCQLFFQALDLLADGRLRGAQFNRRRCEAALTGRRFEGAKQIQ